MGVSYSARCLGVLLCTTMGIPKRICTALDGKSLLIATEWTTSCLLWELVEESSGKHSSGILEFIPLGSLSSFQKLVQEGALGTNCSFSPLPTLSPGFSPSLGTAVALARLTIIQSTGGVENRFQTLVFGSQKEARGLSSNCKGTAGNRGSPREP